MRARSIVGASVVAGALVAACGPDWDALDPSLGSGETGGAGASSSGIGASGAGSSTGTTSSNGGTGGCNADDMNDCTSDDCQDGVPVHDALPDGTACASDGGHVCNGGQCVECNVVADCEAACKTAKMCKGHSCFMTSNKVAGAGCSVDGGQVCDGMGNCVECVNNTNCTMPETCGGGGTPNECGCTPTATCASLGLTCGTGSDGCGMSIDCNDATKNGNETDVDCGGGGACTVKCMQGDTCLAGTDCTGGNCADGLCCDAACTAQCKACNVNGSEGKCVNIPKNGVDTTGTLCSGLSACDGAGNCKKAIGQPCALPGDCASGNCTSLVCAP